MKLLSCFLTLILATAAHCSINEYASNDLKVDARGIPPKKASSAPASIITPTATLDKRQGGLAFQPTAANYGASINPVSNCATATLTPSYPSPIVAPGFNAQLIIQGLYNPRGIVFDQSGHLLVLQSGAGITSLTFQDGGGTCLGLLKNITLVVDNTVSSSIFKDKLTL
jgi:hypothetical protein